MNEENQRNNNNNTSTPHSTDSENDFFEITGNDNFNSCPCRDGYVPSDVEFGQSILVQDDSTFLGEIDADGLLIRGGGIGASDKNDSVEINSNLVPKDNEEINLGSAEKPFHNIFCQNNPISVSDRRMKTKINDLDPEDCLKFINSLKPKTFQFKRKKGVTHLGFIAQETASPGREFLSLKKDDLGYLAEGTQSGMMGLRYDQFISPLVGAVQQLTSRTELLECQLASKQIQDTTMNDVQEEEEEEVKEPPKKKRRYAKRKGYLK